MAQGDEQVNIILRTPTGPFASVPDQTNVLSFSLAGDGEITLSLLAKKPGVELQVERAAVTLPLAQLPDAEPLPPYVRLIHDVLTGDRSLFTRPDGLAAAWKAAAPLLDNPPRPAPYEQGSWGPAKARKLAAPHGWLLGQ
jgi:glucose-6-phosphate 1-dehydrogenase